MKVPGMVQGVFGAKLPDGLQLLPAEEITVATLQQLEKHLDDRVSNESATQTHLFYLRKINSTTGKLNYLREVLLPGKRVMVRAYHLKLLQRFLSVDWMGDKSDLHAYYGEYLCLRLASGKSSTIL